MRTNTKTKKLTTQDWNRIFWEIRLPRRGGVVRYLTRMPKPGEVPPGHLLVHNTVRPTRRIGSRGFRIWLIPTDDTSYQVEVCPCGWAAELGDHYRVRNPFGGAR